MVACACCDYLAAALFSTLLNTVAAPSPHTRTQSESHLQKSRPVTIYVPLFLLCECDDKVEFYNSLGSLK